MDRACTPATAGLEMPNCAPCQRRRLSVVTSRRFQSQYLYHLMMLCGRKSAMSAFLYNVNLGLGVDGMYGVAMTPHVQNRTAVLCCSTHTYIAQICSIDDHPRREMVYQTRVGSLVYAAFLCSSKQQSNKSLFCYRWIRFEFGYNYGSYDDDDDDVMVPFSIRCCCGPNRSPAPTNIVAACFITRLPLLNSNFDGLIFSNLFLGTIVGFFIKRTNDELDWLFVGTVGR